jgi:hypothetical protein
MDATALEIQRCGFGTNTGTELRVIVARNTALLKWKSSSEACVVRPEGETFNTTQIWPYYFALDVSLRGLLHCNQHAIRGNSWYFFFFCIAADSQRGRCFPGKGAFLIFRANSWRWAAGVSIVRGCCEL